LDFYGNEVFFSGVSWNGLENIDGAPHGLWARSWQSMLDQMVGLGLNVLRLPFSGTMLRGNYMPQNINYFANPDLRNLTSLQIMDTIIRGAGQRRMKVILDYHRLNAGYLHEWGLWYDANTSETQWINNWLFVVDRYKNDSTVVGVGLFNEPHHDEAIPPGHLGPEWAPDGVNATINWRTAAIRCGNAIHKVNPNLLIAVQGLDVYKGQYGLWGGVFLGQLDAPLNLTVPNKLIFETHDLGPSTFNQSYYNAPDFPSNLPAQWDRMWGFLWDRNMTPVWVGEFGAKFDPYCTSPLCLTVLRQEQLWLGELTRYIQNKSLPWTWWSWDPTSADTGGLLADDMQTLRVDKYAYIQNLTYPGFTLKNSSAVLPTGIRTTGA
jgi:endoglucanase